MKDPRTISYAGHEEDPKRLGLASGYKDSFGSGVPTIPGYRIKRLVHSGGMGKVYFATKISKVAWFPSLDVAVKTLLVANPSPRAIKDFRKECRRLSAVDWHPGIAKIYDAGEYLQGGVALPFYAMQYIPGERTLRKYVQESRPKAEEIVEILAEVCSALQASHEAGVYHHDIKPENILIDPIRRPVLIDFGVARAAFTDGADAATRRRGTREYMSPEQARGDATSPPAASDIYSLGFTLYELINGRRPYEVDSADPAWPDVILTTPPAKMRDDFPGLDEPLKQIIIKSLQKRAEDRFTSAEAFRKELKNWLENRVRAAAYKEARRETGWWKLRGWLSRRLRTALVLTFVAAVLLCEALVLPLVYLTPLNAWWLELAAAIAPPPAPPPDNQTILVAITDVTSMSRLAGSAGITGVLDGEPKTWRALHGAFVERMATAKPSVIAFDIFMPQPQDGDARFLEGVRKSAGLGVPVIIVADSWEVSDLGPSGVSSSLIDPALNWAPATVDQGYHPASLDLAIRHPGRRPIASLALQAFSLAQGRGQLSSIEFDQTEPRIALGFSRDGRRSSHPVSYYEVATEPDVKFGVQADDETAVLDVLLPEDAWFERATLSYEYVFEMEESARRAAMGGKTIVVADLRAGSDLKDVGDRGTVPGAYLHIAAIDALRRITGVREYLPSLHPWMAAAAAAVGVGLGAQFWRRWKRIGTGLALWGVASALTFALCLLIFRLTLIAVDPWVLSLAMLMAGALAVVVRNMAEEPSGGTRAVAG